MPPAAPSSSAISSRSDGSLDVPPSAMTTHGAIPSTSNRDAASPSRTHSGGVSSAPTASSSASADSMTSGNASTSSHDHSSPVVPTSSPVLFTSIPLHDQGPRPAEPVTTAQSSTTSPGMPLHTQGPRPAEPVTTTPSIITSSLQSTLLSSSKSHPNTPSAPPSDPNSLPITTSAAQDSSGPTVTVQSTSTSSERTLRIIDHPSTTADIASSTTTPTDTVPPTTDGRASITPSLSNSRVSEPAMSGSDSPGRLGPSTTSLSSDTELPPSTFETTPFESTAANPSTSTAVLWPAPGSSNPNDPLVLTTADPPGAEAGNGAPTSPSPLSAIPTTTEVTHNSVAAGPDSAQPHAHDAGRVAGICIGVLCGVGLGIALFYLLRVRRKNGTSATLFARDQGCSESVANLRLSLEVPTNPECSERGSYHTTLDVRMSSGTYDFPLPPTHALQASMNSGSLTVFCPSPDPFRASNRMSSVSQGSTPFPSSTFAGSEVVPDDWETAWNLPRPSSELMRRAEGS
ncbi:hypothetical protein OH77DRAFT_1155979 [Trametes cingulata]|nr:hypothetical protein OH77DRAFT_1155979 [Trametes cingulata]